MYVSIEEHLLPYIFLHLEGSHHDVVYLISRLSNLLHQRWEIMHLSLPDSTQNVSFQPKGNPPQVKTASSPRHDIALALSHTTPLYLPISHGILHHPFPQQQKEILHLPRRANRRASPSTPQTNPHPPPRPRLQRLLLRAPAPRHHSPFPVPLFILQTPIPATPPTHQVHLPHRLQAPRPLLQTQCHHPMVRLLHSAHPRNSDKAGRSDVSRVERDEPHAASAAGEGSPRGGGEECGVGGVESRVRGCAGGGVVVAGRGLWGRWWGCVGGCRWRGG